MRVHQSCKGAPGAPYRVTEPVLTGTNAVVNVSAGSPRSELGSDQENFIYRGGRWCFVVPDLALYRHHSAAQVTAELRSLNECG